MKTHYVAAFVKWVAVGSLLSFAFSVPSHGLEVTVSLGQRSTLPQANGVRVASERAKQLEGYLGSEYAAEATGRSFKSFSGEVGVAKQLGSGMRLGAGLRFDRQGYCLNTAVIRHDLDVQFDQWMWEKEEYSVWLVSVPLSLGHLLVSRVWVDGGLTFGFPMRSTATTRLRIDHAVFANGIRNQNLEAPGLEKEESTGSETRSFVPGAFLKMGIPISGSAEMDVRAWWLADPMEPEARDAGGRGISVGLGYRFALPGR